VIFCEFSKPGAEEPYYPVRTRDNLILFQKYLELAKREQQVIMGGRLGRYAYMDMDITILSALNCYRENFG